MPPHLQSQAIKLRLAKDDVDLLQKTIAYFVEVNIQLKASELNPIDEWENWDDHQQHYLRQLHAPW